MRLSILTCHFFLSLREAVIGRGGGGEWWRGNSQWFCSVHLQHQWLEWCHTAWLTAHCAKTALLAECHMIQLTEKNWAELLWGRKENMLMKKMLCSLKLLEVTFLFDESTNRIEGVTLLNTEITEATKVLSATHLEMPFCLQSSAQSHSCWATHFSPGLSFDWGRRLSSFDPQSALLPRRTTIVQVSPGYSLM